MYEANRSYHTLRQPGRNSALTDSIEGWYITVYHCITQPPELFPPITA